jgi:excinuclease ABC subunit C
VLRRYRALLEAGGPFPDLIVIDGGKGQLSAAYEALEELGLGEPGGRRARQEGGAALHARPRPSRSRCPHGPALRLLQRIRDEAHRFAVTFHRQARAMRDLRSELDECPGIGPRRRKALLTRSAAWPACAARPARN